MQDQSDLAITPEMLAQSKAHFAAIQNEHGVDLSLIRSNLQVSPTERVRRMEAFADEIRRIQAHVRAQRRKTI